MSLCLTDALSQWESELWDSYVEYDDDEFLYWCDDTLDNYE